MLPHAKPAWRMFLAIFVLAAAVRILLAVESKFYDQPAYGEAVMVARSVARVGSFANPFQISTGPTAHVAPAYTYLLALILTFIPWGHGFAICAVALAILGSSLVWASLPAAASHLGIDARAGLAGALFGAVNPLRHATELNGCWEAPYSALALITLVVLTFERRRDFGSARNALLLGSCWGLSLLLQPEFLAVFLALLLVLAWNSRQRLGTSLRAAAIALASMAIVVSPWIIRNEIALGGPTFIRSNFGLELDLSNNDHASASIGDNLHRNPQTDHPDVNLPENRRMAEMGELRYYRFRLNRGLAWIAGHPGHFLWLTAQRFADFWAPTRRSSAIRMAEILLFLAAAAGLAMLIRDRNPVSVFFVAIWLAQPFVYYFIQAAERYRYPIEWTINLCAGYCALKLFELTPASDVARKKIAFPTTPA